MVSEHLFTDLEIFKTYNGDTSGSLISTFPLATKSGVIQAETRLRNWGQSPPEFLHNLNWVNIGHYESFVEKLFEKRDERIEEFYGQVFVAGKFNAYSSILQCILVYMTWLLPIGSLLAPIIFLIAPLLFMYMKGGDYKMSEYMHVIQNLLAEQSSIWSSTISSSPTTWISRGIYLIGIAAVYFSAFWAQWQTAQRIERVVENIREQIEGISNYIKSVAIGIHNKYVDTLVKYVPELLMINKQTTNGTIASLYWKITQSDSISCIKRIYESVGSADVANMIHNMKENNEICEAKSSKKTCIRLKDAYHPCIVASKRVTNDYIFVDKLHAIVTGPNRGGKSTMLKTIGINVLMAKAFGVCYARKARISNFEHIETYINITDRNGLQSLFESELSRCVNYLERLKTVSSSLLIMDEVFHSTNPVDGIIAGQRFIKRLHTTEPLKHISIITTHYKELTENTYNLCIESLVENGKIVYTYKLRPGTNFMSSVGELLDSTGL